MTKNSINLTRLLKSEKSLKSQFTKAKPFGHLIIENFFYTNHASKLISEFPSPEEMGMSSAFSGVAESKKQLSDLKKMPQIFQKTFKDLSSPVFMNFLSRISGIKPLYDDKKLTGGGLHQGATGSFLDIHADFNLDKKTGKYRRLNILIYLNKSWKDSWQGHLELWDKDMRKMVKKVKPEFNKCVIFATDIDSYHGYKKMILPKGKTRKSLAAYYYSNNPAPGEIREFHNTLFKARPGELRNTILYPLMTSKILQKIKDFILSK